MRARLVVLLSLTFVSPLTAQNSGFGLGLIVGEPTGLSFKNWLDGTTAWDFAVAWSLEKDHSFTMHGDYLKHNFRLFSAYQGRLPLYFGVGGTLRFNDSDAETRFGMRIPVGVNYHLDNVPLGLFVEIVPVLNLFPETEFRLNAAIGARYFFGS
ncbi:hypothetical protein MJD09_09835 [bacterium]|nr:hypothetical protein [bacterium]